jgi:hypothetical protein
MLDLKGTPDDPSGYAKFRAFIISASERLDGPGVDAAERMRAAATFTEPITRLCSTLPNASARVDPL